MEPKLRKILNRYLGEIEARLEGISCAARKEFITEIRSHLVEKWESSGEKTEESLLQVINDFGDPREIAEDYLTKVGGEARVRRTYPSTWLVLTLTALIWPVGIILAWVSPAWKFRDKIIATLIPIVIFLLLLTSSLPAVREVHKLTTQVQLQPIETEVQR
ncbi:hypothetical protein MTHERMOG20_15620 [Moorella thermoacetica]|uniref:DUF1700 domain-containing protein n=2 Tax=Neomoorella thermoacetica TaxID=1525 RepID=A0A1J5NUX6_NEOTH|nr:hypothetical protein [Moorella thermoacetica]AKX95203.1 hypothetical protein MOTHE_c24240 [Moorella thermoacetica]AKX97828.1 hypothetical protein MOTHA_c24960 [Moorella thermoacetica]OIQ10006.1 hypothetical protein MOOR_00760 [Moorella thermoacetica]OIQ56659.1 hypothetical protein MOCA_12360 [Moorella thermoacetica]OIQ62534.1 hypothetical protein MTIN_07740 [Moorella thermoacetica]